MTETKQLEELRKILQKTREALEIESKEYLIDELEVNLLSLLKEEKLKLLEEVEMKKKTPLLFKKGYINAGTLSKIVDENGFYRGIGYNACIDDLNTKLSKLREELI